MHGSVAQPPPAALGRPTIARVFLAVGDHPRIGCWQTSTHAHVAAYDTCIIQRPSVCESSAGQMSRAVSTWRPGRCLAGNDRRGKPPGSTFPWAGLQAT